MENKTDDGFTKVFIKNFKILIFRYGEDRSEQKKGYKDITYHNKWDNKLVFK